MTQEVANLAVFQEDLDSDLASAEIFNEEMKKKVSENMNKKINNNLCNSLVSGQCRSQNRFLTQSELIKPLSPQAAQLGVHFVYYFHNTQLEMHLLERPD